MKEFNAPSMWMMTPDDWTDASTYILLGPRVGGFHANIVVNLSRSVPEPDLAKHVEKHLDTLAKMQGFGLLSRQLSKDEGSRPLVILEFQWDQPQGVRLQQRQVFMWVEGDVYCLTASAPARQFAAVAPQFAQVLATFRPKQWPPQQ